jgi:hypothetical protein
MGVPNRIPKLGSHVGVPIPKSGPNQGPKSGSQIGVPNWGPKFDFISREVTFCCSVLHNSPNEDTMMMGHISKLTLDWDDDIDIAIWPDVLGTGQFFFNITLFYSVLPSIKGQIKVGVLRASHKIFLSLTGKFEWKFSRFHLCTAQTFHANFPVRLKKSLWDSRTTATLVHLAIS